MPRTEVLRFSRMALRREGTPGQRFVQLFVSLALRLFFRRVETYGAEAVPTNEPLLFVLNHPNGLIDPALIFCALPRRISFLAKSTLFRLPVLGRLLGLVEALPLYRRVDAPADVSLNRRTKLSTTCAAGFAPRSRSRTTVESFSACSSNDTRSTERCARSQSILIGN